MTFLGRWQQPSGAMRFFAFAVLLLQIIAPLWHVCELGSGSPDQHNEHGALQKTVSDAQTQTPQTPLICFCPAPKAEPPHGPALTALEKHKHGFCLALLLQTTPFAPAQAPQFALISTVSHPIYRGSETRNFSRFYLRENGRAPPVSL